MVPTTRTIDIRELKRNYVLRESYKRTDFYTCIGFFRDLWLWQTGQIPEKEFNQNNIKRKMRLQVIDDDRATVSGKFVPDTGLIIITFSQSFLDLIQRIQSKFDAADYAKLEEVADYFWTCFVHEDTHRQQVEATTFRFFDKYVTYDFNTDPFDLDIIQNLKYYNQPIEADAYGREVAETLRLEYPKRTEDINPKLTPTENIFKWIDSKEIKDRYALSLILTYKDPRISDKARKNFYRAIYDYLTDLFKDGSIF